MTKVKAQSLARYLHEHDLDVDAVTVSHYDSPQSYYLIIWRNDGRAERVRCEADFTRYATESRYVH